MTNLGLYVFFAKNRFMKIGVVADERSRDELLSQGLRENCIVEWLDKPTSVPGAVAYIDLLFKPGIASVTSWEKMAPALIIVDSVIETLPGLPSHFIRINAWPTFLKRTLVEAATQNESLKETATQVFSCFNKNIEWVPDTPGFISARVVSMIINEAYFALQDHVSSKEEIDTAMKLGTNYPYGPFEWSKKIGLENISNLLGVLAAIQPRYTPAALLNQEALLA
jgi:3-hydroxybutyryl-CoA dehydrogenase